MPNSGVKQLARIGRADGRYLICRHQPAFEKADLSVVLETILRELCRIKVQRRPSALLENFPERRCCGWSGHKAVSQPSRARA